MAGKARSVRDRIYERSMPEPNSGCWLWLAGIGNRGYGSLSSFVEFPGEVGAHRLSYLVHKGPIPEGMHIMHSCDNRICVNPDHLSVGTQQDNIADQIKKKRTHGVRGLTQEEIEYARSVWVPYARNTGQMAKLAAELGVHEQTLRVVLKNGYTESNFKELVRKRGK